MSNDKPLLFGPGGAPITETFHYPLGDNVLALNGTPEEIFARGFHAVDNEGRPVGNMQQMILGTWASASAAVRGLMDPMVKLECRMAAMERVLKRENEKLHQEYVHEVAVVSGEMQAAAQAHMAAQAQAAGQETPS